MAELYRETRGSGPDLVLLHGWGMHSAIWGPALERLQEHFRVTTIDLPGHGRSRWRAGGFDDSVLLPMLAAAAPERATWVGWSLGGLVAQAFAHAHTARVARLWLVASTPRFVNAPDWPHATDADIFDQFAAGLAADWKQTLGRFLALQSRGSTTAREELRFLREALFEFPPAPEALAAGLGRLRGNDLRAYLPALSMPVRFLLGERDTLVPAAVAHALQRLGAEVEVMAGAGHAPHLSDPAGFAARLGGAA